MNSLNNSFGSSNRAYTNSYTPNRMSSSFYNIPSFPARQSTFRRVVESPTPNAPVKPSALSSPPASFSSLPSTARSHGVVTPPTKYLPPTPPPSSAVKSEPSLLPPSTDYIFRQLANNVLQHRNALHYDCGHQIQIPHVSVSNFEAFLALHGEANILKGIKLEYDSRSCHIIMCPPPTPYHDCTPFFLQSTLFSLRGTPFDTPARQRSLVVREIGFRTSGGSFMVPDAAVVVMPLDAPPRLWPTIVVEVANSQGYDDVLAKVKRWFRNSHGMVEVALVLKFTAKDPILDPSCFLEVWRYGVPVSDEAGDQDAALDGEGSESEETEDPDSATSDGDQHSIHSNTDRTSGNRSSASAELDNQTPEDEFIAANSLDNDCNLPRSDEEHEPVIHTAIADISLSQATDSDSSLSSLDEEPVPGIHTAIADIYIAQATDSDSSLSSLSSLEEEETDIPVTPADQDTASGSSQSSSASTSEYRPTPLHHRRQIILSGPRKTILPVSDSVDRYLTLFYSDFFGSENVPEGRDPNEPVQLDLEELRLEIRLLMGMTEKLQERVKKHAAAESGGGGKRLKR